MDFASENARFYFSVGHRQHRVALDIAEDGVVYADGGNPTLNTIHSIDSAFGRFWRYFISSEHAESTIVILTTDHAHFPEPPFIEVAGEDYEPWFVGRIPLLIYDPTRILPPSFDANYGSSVDFTPSLVHYLGLANRRTPFIGSSMYDATHRSRGVGSAALGNNVFLFDSQGIYRHGVSTRRTRMTSALKMFFGALYPVELSNRIWPEDSAEQRSADE